MPISWSRNGGVLTALYVPAVRPELFAKALGSGADKVILDLEDSVPLDRKSEARSAAMSLLEGLDDHRPAIEVRVNPVGSPDGILDLKTLAAFPGVDVRIPKVSDASDVADAVSLLGDGRPRGIHCLIESARGVERAFAIASAPGVVSIGLGEADLSAELHLSGEESLTWVRSRVVVAAAAAGLVAPMMSVYRDIADVEGLRQSCLAGRQLGMRGRTAVHPKQLPLIREAFAPTSAEIDAASRMLGEAQTLIGQGTAAYQDSTGAFVDEAVLRSARETLKLAGIKEKNEQ